MFGFGMDGKPTEQTNLEPTLEPAPSFPREWWGFFHVNFPNPIMCNTGIEQHFGTRLCETEKGDLKRLYEHVALVGGL
jgi:hypothetical protein